MIYEYNDNNDNNNLCFIITIAMYHTWKLANCLLCHKCEAFCCPRDIAVNRQQKDPENF